MSLEQRLLEISGEIKKKRGEIGKLKFEEMRVRNAIYARDWNERHGWKEVPAFVRKLQNVIDSLRDLTQDLPKTE